MENIFLGIQTYKRFSDSVLSDFHIFVRFSFKYLKHSNRQIREYYKINDYIICVYDNHIFQKDN